MSDEYTLNSSKEQEIAIYKYAIETKEVSYAMAIATYYYMQEKYNEDPINRALNGKYYPQLLKIFIENNGAIKYTNASMIALGFAAAMTVDNKIHIANGDVSNKTLETLYRFDVLSNGDASTFGRK